MLNATAVEFWKIIHQVRHRPRALRSVGMSKRPTYIPGPSEEDVQRALGGDPTARERVKRQKTRVKKRLREIDEYDRLYDR